MNLIRARAPLRLGLAGGGTDVSPYSDIYGGVVLNATINMYAYAILEPSNNKSIQFSATDRDEYFECGLTDFIEPEGDLLLHKGVYNRIVKDFNNGEPLPIKLITCSDAVAGSGLGTSSTMVVAMIKAFVEWLNLPLGEYDIAHLAYEIERVDLGLSGGKQDQYAATFGGVNFMEFYEDNRVIVNPLRIKNWVLSELESSLVLYYTGQSRDSATIIEDQIKNVQQSKHKTTEALHLIKEDAFLMKEFLLTGDIKKFGEYFDKSWQDKKRVSSSITNQKIDDTYSLAKRSGAYAGKVSGAGGGGFMMFLVDPAKRMDVIKALSNTDGRVMNCHFTKWGTQGWQIKN